MSSLSVDIGGAESRQRELTVRRKFTRERGDESACGVRIDTWSAGPGLVDKPGPARVSVTISPFTYSLASTGELAGDLGVIVAASS